MAILLKKYIGQVNLALLVVISACSLSYKPELKKSQSYTLSLPAKWKVLPADSADHAYQDESGSIVFYNSICKKHSQKEVEILQRNLFQGIADLKIISKNTINLYQREAARTIASGKLDGVKVNIFSNVFNRNFCTYDVVFISPHVDKLKRHKKIFKQLEKAFIFKD